MSKLKLPKSRVKDEELRAWGWRRAWLIYSKSGKTLRCRGRVVRFVDHIFETEDSAFAEALLELEDCAYEGVMYFDEFGDRVMPPKEH